MAQGKKWGEARFPMVWKIQDTRCRAQRCWCPSQGMWSLLWRQPASGTWLVTACPFWAPSLRPPQDVLRSFLRTVEPHIVSPPLCQMSHLCAH